MQKYISVVFLVTVIGSLKGALGGSGAAKHYFDYTRKASGSSSISKSNDTPPPYEEAASSEKLHEEQPRPIKRILPMHPASVRVQPMHPVVVTVSQPGAAQKICCGYERKGCECQPRGVTRPKHTSARCFERECSCFDMRENPSGPFSCSPLNDVSQCIVSCFCWPDKGASRFLYENCCLLPVALSCCSCYWPKFEGGSCGRSEEKNCVTNCLDWLIKSKQAGTLEMDLDRPPSTKATCLGGECSCFDLRKNPSGPFESQRLNKISQCLIFSCCCPFDKSCNEIYDQRIRNSGCFAFPLTCPLGMLACACYAQFEVDEDSNCLDWWRGSSSQ